MKKVLALMIVCICANFLFAQTTITVPDTITTAGHYLIEPAGGTFQIDTTGAGFIRAAIYIAGQDTDSYNQMVPGVNDVGIDGQGATIIGYGPEETRSTEFGIWFQNDLRAFPEELQDTTYRDTVVNVTIERFKYGVAFRQVADGLIEGCTFDSCQKAIELMSTGRNVRNKILNNVISRAKDKGISVRGSWNTIDNNQITNYAGYGKYGINIDRNYSGWNEITNNRIQGGIQAGLCFNNSHKNTTDGNVISDANRGIYSRGDAYGNVMQNDSIMTCNFGLVFVNSDNETVKNATLLNNKVGVSLNGATDILIEDSEISGSDSISIELKNGATLTLINTTFDEAKVVVTGSSVLYLGAKRDVNVTVQLGDGNVVGATVELVTDYGEVLISGTTDENGRISFSVSDTAITESGKSGISIAMGTRVVDRVEKIVDGEGYIYQPVAGQAIDAQTDYTFDLVFANHMVITEFGHYSLDLTDVIPTGVMQVDTTGFGKIRAAIWIADPDTNSNSQKLGSVDDVGLDGQGVTLIGYGPEETNSTEFGIWFQNDKRALDDALQDSTLRDTVRSFTIERFKYGVAFRQVADGLIEGCTFDSCQKAIELMSTGRNVRNKILNNVISRAKDKGISVRGSWNTIDNNQITNYAGYGKYGIQIDKNYSEGNIITNNKIQGGTEAGLRFNNSHENTTDGNVISDANRGIYTNGDAFGNVMQNDSVKNCVNGFVFVNSDHEFVDNATIVDNDIGVLVQGGTEILFTDSKISGSDSMDVIAKNNATLFLLDTEFDSVSVAVEEGSAVFLGRYLVDLKVTIFQVVSVPNVSIQVLNASGEQVGAGKTDSDGLLSLGLYPEGYTASGYIPDQNPFTFYSSITLGEDLYTDTLTATVTGDTAYSFDLEAVVSNIDLDQLGIPKVFALNQNFPNPFNPSTTIRYQLPQATHVSINVYNLLGQMMTTLVDEDQKAGYKAVVWDGTNSSGHSVSSGLYIYRMKAGEFIDVKRMIFLK